MGALLKYEFHKLVRQKSFYVCVAIIALMALINFLIWAYTPIKFNLLDLLLSGGEMPEKTSSGFGAMQEAMGGLSSQLPLMLGIALAIYIISDYSQSTIKNVYARGFTRTEVYFAKFLVSLAMMLTMFLLVMLLSFIGGTLEFEVGKPDGTFFKLLSTQLLVCAAITAIEFFICIAVKNLPGAIVIIVGGTQFLLNILQLIDLILASKDIDFRISKLYIGSFLSDLGNSAIETPRFLFCLIGAVVYAAAFLTLGWLINRKSEK
ncbi:MAG: ABC transporter permease [Clostridia bacterium]|nr:ABC transporter permease [Clostridia bacterium]